MYMEKIQSIAVYCGARLGNNLAYELVAEELGRELAVRKIRLVYGGGGIWPDFEVNYPEDFNLF